MIYGTLVCLAKHEPLPPPGWLIRLRNWIKSKNGGGRP